MSVYAKFIHVLIFSHFLLTGIHSFSTENNIIACSPLETTYKTKDSTLFIKAIFASLSLISGLTAQYGKQKKIAMELKTTSYWGEKEKFRKYQTLAFYLIVFYNCTLLTVSAITNLVLLRRFQNRTSYTRAVFCVVYNNLCLIFEYGLISWFFSVCMIIGYAIKKRFDVLSVELQQINSVGLKRNINEIICKHVELCDFLQEINEKWNEYIFFEYGILLTFVSLLIYNTVFWGSHLPLQVYLMFSLCAVVYVIFGFIASFVVAQISASAYGSFQEIRKLGAAALTLETKLKVKESGIEVFNNV
ncbi:uncharacterized protein LOC111615707 [Centruroides sculpturatus]|uniref:uncharacterized protein LOC111615707 n=1 Tax=Centruroides sculpturatus TaxID=218467 RepID=UPI000C6D1E96|nr:uncharacterized protein LOC111615707 [Centruroides sculpturatus]